MSGAGEPDELESVYEVHGAVVSEAAPDSVRHDALVLVTLPGAALPPLLAPTVAAAQELDHALLTEVSLVQCPLVAGNRLIISPTGPLTPYDDVRSVYEAGRAGVRRAVAAGARRPVLALQALRPADLGLEVDGDWSRSELVALLAALEALYIPLEVRESYPERLPRLTALGVWAAALPAALQPLLRTAVALERGRALARDIGGADPERMSPPNVAKHVRDAFADSCVRVRVLDEPDELRRRYPLLAAVARAAHTVPRHRGCVIFLDYEPESYDETIMLVGKGVTYDTGGCDVKTGGAMAGMSRDKCGAAAIAGFLKACELLQPRLRVRAALGVVRNSLGADAYVADELLRSRAGLPVRVGNTDAEGRLVMADLLAEMAEQAAAVQAAGARAHVLTVATLTGHAVRAAGEGYGIAVDNAAARRARTAEALAAAAGALAEPLEVSRLRREDFAAHRGQAPGDALLQAAPLPSTQVNRGHQTPAAFLAMVSGLAGGAGMGVGGGAAGVPYTHLDVAASAGSAPAPPTAAPLLALAASCGLLDPC
ncbi:unnamed protein product [Parnassius apollo]|uniref:(apollo) hypothetical protein n=1 Tax=Parnassius apollo TaxID=110799 RepID=A0A8S3W0C0_PARAO|nr:unnamed protein product [Parnassius apollo]